MKIEALNWRKYAVRRTAPGTGPGVLTVDPEAPPSVVNLMAYGPDGEAEVTGITDFGTISDYLDRYAVTWVDVQGLGDAETIQKLGDLFQIHRLALEDIVQILQRPKVEAYEGQLFIVARMPHKSLPLVTEQISLVLGSNYLVTFQETRRDVFDPVRSRIRERHPHMLSGKPDYLAYTLLDALVDSYFPILEECGEFLEKQEEEILGDPTPAVIPRLHHLKRDLLHLRRYTWPLREMLGSLYRDDSALIAETTRHYLRDCYDHTIQLLDLVESYRDVGSGLMELYLSSISNRMNEVMKMLTIIATIFIPLGFFAGVYGMNFDTSSPWNMPELRWKFGYLTVLAGMAVVAGGLLFFFRHRGWLGGSRRGK